MYFRFPKCLSTMGLFTKERNMVSLMTSLCSSYIWYTCIVGRSLWRSFSFAECSIEYDHLTAEIKAQFTLRMEIMVLPFVGTKAIMGHIQCMVSGHFSAHFNTVDFVEWMISVISHIKLLFFATCLNIHSKVSQVANKSQVRVTNNGV